jgi:guanine nucleotide-binding protein G(i) subunit alpha
MKIIHDNGYSEEEKLIYKSLVNSNTVQSLYIILQAMENLHISFGEKDNENNASNFCLEAEGTTN